ncbi:MAG: cation-translocating P-type ATPase [Bacillota bacterium]
MAEQQSEKNYLKSKEELLNKLDSDKSTGLEEKKISKRLEKYGKNKLRESKGVSGWEVLYNQFKDLMIILLFVTVIAAFLIGDIIEGIAVLGIIIFNTLLGFVTEYRAEKSMESLKGILTPTSKVIRSGDIKEISAEELVPGDILLLEEGDKISADGRLLESSNLSVNESVLTGESETVSKDAEFQAAKELPLAERNNMVFMGTNIVRGSGTVLVTATGPDTEMGKIGTLIEETEDDDTPLEKRLDRMGKSLVIITLVVTVIVIIFGVLVGNPLITTIKTGIALAIAAVPEGLPIIATITLAIGMSKMVHNNALVRRLLAVETLGSTTTICTDKTGTITENQMTLSKIWLKNKLIDVSGTGYEPEGDFSIDGEKVNPEDNKGLSLFLKAGTFCSNAVLDKKEDNGLYDIVGEPTEGAFVVAAKKGGYDRDEMEKNGHQRLAEIPFNSERMYMAVLYRTSNQSKYIYMKGSPSIVIDLCSNVYIDGQVRQLDEDIKRELKKQNKEMASKGLRVLAVAYQGDVEAESEEDLKNTIDSGITFLGFAGIIDPPREGVKEAIETAHKAGVSTKLITGDQTDTALAIAGDVGIVSEGKEAITGTEITNMSTAELNDCIKKYSVFTRVSPENKLQIVDALNESNEITAMTGDGVNDAPALKKADIGVSMGQRGTSVAREASDMVLLDDSFATIVKAIKEGRVIFDNIQKFIYFLFTNNLSKIIYIFLGIVLQVPLPLLALQILWINLVIDVFPALALAWEEPEENIMERSPRDPSRSILNSDFNKKIFIHSFILAVIPMAVYLLSLNSGHSLVLSRTISFEVISFIQLFHIFDARRKEGIGFDRTLLHNKYLWAAVILSFVLQISTIFLPFMQNILSTTVIPTDLWPMVMAGVAIPILIIQLLEYYKS